MAGQEAAGSEERWRVLDHLDDWLRVPMIVLSLAWLAIVIIELTHGASALLEIFGTAIWVIFILEFALRITTTASFASFFVGRDAEEAAGPVAGTGDLIALRDEIAALRRDLGRDLGRAS